MTCAKCGAPLAGSETFCGKCGARSAVSAPWLAQQELCQSCGTPLTAADKFCAKCGAPRSLPASAPAAIRATAANEHAPVEPQSERGPLAPVLPARGGAPSFPPQTAASSSAQKSAAVKLVAIVVAILLIVAGAVYLSQSARKKVELARQAAAQKKAADFLRSLAGQNGSNQQAPANSQSGQNESLDSLLKKVQSAAQTAPQANGQPTQNGTGQPSGENATNSGAPTTASTPAPPAIPPAPTVPGPGALEHTVGGPEADLLVRTGYMDNFGFGWPQGFDVFSGNSTPPHAYPWTPPAGAPDGTDRILFGSVVTALDRTKHGGDGYSGILWDCCGTITADTPPSKGRLASMPTPISLDVSGMPAKVNAVLIQIFVDDFQAPVFHSRFQATLNGTRIPPLEDVLNALDQTGPIGKLISVKLLPEYWPLLQTGTVKLLIDDPTTHAADGYAIGFVRILVNPHSFKYVVSAHCTVTDADNGTAIAAANVSAAVTTTTSDKDGKCELDGLPAGMVVASASAPGYDADTETADLPAGQTGNLNFKLHAHQESTAALERAIAETGTATIYGIHFDTGSAKLRADSLPALNAVLGLINNHAGSKWTIAGHTDNQGNPESNQKLSEARAQSVIAWLGDHGVSKTQLVAQGFGQTKPVADNATASGRALNRRVEVAPAK